MVGERCSVGAVGKSWRVRRVIAMHMRAFVESWKKTDEMLQTDGTKV